MGDIYCHMNEDERLIEDIKSDIKKEDQAHKVA